MALWPLCSTLNSWIGGFVFWCHKQVINSTSSIINLNVDLLLHILRYVNYSSNHAFYLDVFSLWLWYHKSYFITKSSKHNHPSKPSRFIRRISDSKWKIQLDINEQTLCHLVSSWLQGLDDGTLKRNWNTMVSSFFIVFIKIK